MPTIEIEVKVECACGERLDAVTDREWNIIVDPCGKCGKEDFDKGWDEGYAECEKDNNL